MEDLPEDLAIRVRNVGKTYRLGVISRRTLRDEFAYRWLRLRGTPAGQDLIPHPISNKTLNT